MSSGDSVLETLQQALEEKKAGVDVCVKEVKEARQRLASARADQKRVERALRAFGANGQEGSDVTKRTVRPLVTKVLSREASGLPEGVVKERVEVLLRQGGSSPSGLALILRALRGEFQSESGSVWFLHDRGQTENS